MDAFQLVGIVAGWVLVVFVGSLCAILLYWILTGKINISRIISEPNGDASLSRLQFLIFTVVISMSLFLVTMETKPAPALPTIPDTVMMLLGISGSSYLVSKGIQFSSPAGISRPSLQLSADTQKITAASAQVQLTVSLPGSAAGAQLPPITWSLDAPALGTIQDISGAKNTYTAPSALPAPASKVRVRAQAAGFEDGTVDIALG